MYTMEPSGIFEFAEAVFVAVEPLPELMNLSTRRKATAKINKMFTMENSFFMVSFIKVLII